MKKEKKLKKKSPYKEVKSSTDILKLSSGHANDYDWVNLY